MISTSPNLVLEMRSPHTTYPHYYYYSKNIFSSTNNDFSSQISTSSLVNYLYSTGWWSIPPSTHIIQRVYRHMYDTCVTREREREGCVCPEFPVPDVVFLLLNIYETHSPLFLVSFVSLNKSSLSLLFSSFSHSTSC